MILLVFKKTKGCITFSIMLHATNNTLITSLGGSYSSISKYYKFLNDNEIKLVMIMIAIIVLIAGMETILSNKHKDEHKINAATK